MPKGTRVHKMYAAMRRSGMPAAKAARVAQAKTHQVLKTGKPIRKAGGRSK